MIQLKAHTMKHLSTKKLNKRQELILDYIANENSAFSIADIFAFVKKEEEDISRITIVRDMGLLADEGLLLREGAGRAVRYRISAQYNLLKKVDVQKYFDVPQDDRVIRKQFNHDIFTLLSENIFTDKEQKRLLSLHAEFQKHLRNIGSTTLIKKEFERIMIEFSWKSSQIEGNTYSLLDTEALLKDNIKAAGKTAEETQMILNHKKAFNFIMENRNEFAPLSRAKIEHIHSLLVENLHVTPNLRKSPVGITGTNYRPLDNQFQIAEAFAEMINLINSKKDFFEKSFLSLVLISYIQAFEDGNKRTARLTSNALLLAYDSMPMSYRAVNEIEYKKASILFYEQNNLSYFKQVFISQYEFAVHNYFK
jgi:Fe2+ or Zn2+ uptake regulation protein